MAWSIYGWRRVSIKNINRIILWATATMALLWDLRTSVVLHAERDLRKPMDLRLWLGENRSDARKLFRISCIPQKSY